MFGAVAAEVAQRGEVHAVGVVTHLAFGAADACGKEVGQLADDVGRAVAQAVEVGQHDGGLPLVELDDGVLVERDAAPDAVVVRRQQALQVLVVGGKPFHPHIGVGGEVLHPMGMRYHHKVVFHDMVAVLVEHEAPFASGAEHVHAGMAQLRRVHGEEIGRV